MLIGHQVAQVPRVGPLGVFGQTALGTKMSSEGADGVERAGVHDFTLTKPDAFSKDIDTGSYVSCLTGQAPGR